MSRRVVRIVEIFTHASTSPCRVLTEDGCEWVMKFAGAGPGPYGLLVEYLALATARALAVPVPDVCPLYLPPDFPWQMGTDEFDDMVQRSAGWNLGLGLIEGATPLRGAEAVEAASTLDTLAPADAFLQNVDRTAANPNLLRDSSGAIYAIDFDACLFLTRAVAGLEPSFGLPRGHILADVAYRRMPFAHVDWRALLDAAPAAWIETASRTRDQIADALVRYSRHWPSDATEVAQP